MELQDAATTLAKVVTAGLDNELYPPDPMYSEKENCAVLIERRPELNALIHTASNNKDYGPLWRHPSICRTSSKDRLNTYLEKLRPAFTNFVNGDDPPFTPWTPDPDLEPDPSIVAHVESLQIPAVGTKPGLLIHRLGTFEADTQLKGRVDGIFHKHADTFLVNTSGSGKTRLSFEGLCEHWGFYFTVARDANNLGAADIGEDLYRFLNNTPGFRSHLPRPLSPDFSQQLKRNIEIVDERFGLVLLSRLLIFHMYSDIIQSGGIVGEHKRKWLLFQLKPQVPHNSSYDILADVRRLTAGLEPDAVLDLTAVMYFKLRKIYGTEFHLFYVLDEAQLVSRQHTTAFRQADKGYPLLREIIRSWEAKSLPHEASFVIVGTDIPKDGFESAPFADKIRWVSDTGGFDDEDEHRLYVSRFLTPSYQASPAGQEFLVRVWTWCRGRYRSTDALIKALLMDAFRTPHRLLNDYIEKTTTYRPTDYGDDEPFRYPIDVRVHELSPEFFTFSREAPLLKSTVQLILFHYLATAQPPAPFSADLTALVTSGFGRFIDKDLSRVAMDEPMFLLRAARWLVEPPKPQNSVPRVDPPHNSFTVLSRHRTNATSRSLAAFLAFYLTRAFDTGSVVSKVFSFSHKPVPQWANQAAQIIVFNGKDASPVSYESSLLPALAASATTLDSVESWLDGLEGTPFCLTPSADPDILFHLKLEDGRFVRIILHSTVTESILRNLALKTVMKRLEPGNLLRQEGVETDSVERERVVGKLLDTAQADGPFRILRAIASFPAKTYLKTLSSKYFPPVANLNTGMFERLAEEIPVSDVLERLVAAVTVGKRKRKRDSPPPEAKARKRAHVGPDAPTSSQSRTRKGKQRAS
ncbi:hypothetical protein B0H11DRAFT_1115562 [Mycena galericulata]|nr:hypothetical protein B0H11DRAFT_1115562 [Mycena galericulata]